MKALHPFHQRSWLALTVLSLCVAPNGIRAQDAAAEPQAIKAAGGQLTVTVPADWKVQPVRSRIIEHELSIPAVDGDSADGRLTMMGAGGSLQANLDRWKGQFKNGSEPKQESWKWDDQDVTLLDLRGTFLDRRGPFGPATERPEYRMLGAIVQLKTGGLYFVKFYGPAATVEANATAFRKMLGSK